MMSDNKYIPRTFQTPNAHVDELMHLLSGNEFKLLIFATRHILGWQDKISSRKANISLSMFEKGFTTKDGTHYNGCGLAKGTIISNLAQLAKFNILIPVGKATNAGQKYELTTNPDINGLTERHNESKTSKQKQTAKARKINKNNTGGQLNSTSTVEQTTGSTVEQTGGGQLNSTESNPLSNTKKHKLPDGDKKPIFSELKESNQVQLIIDAWVIAIEKQGFIVSGNPYSNQTNQKDAKKLIKVGIVPSDIDAYVSHLFATDDWYSDKVIPFSKVVETCAMWKKQQPAQPDKPTPSPANVEPPPAEMIHKWIANGKSIRDILNIMGAAKIPEHKAIKYLNELGVTA